MNTFQLDCFLSVAYHLSFAKAAEQLNISQPAVTHQIQSLESELNVKLFRRTTRQVELTTEGLLFLEDAKSINALSKRAMMRFQNKDEQEILDLSIGYTCQSQLELLLESLKKLAERYPNLHPKLSSIPETLMASLVNDGRIDAAIGIQNSGLLKKSLQYKELFKIPLACICSIKKDFLVTEAEIHLDDLKPYPLVLFRPGSAAPEITQLQLGLSENKKPSELFFCETTEAAILLVRAGFGITVLPDIFLTQCPDLKKFILSDAPMLSFGIHYKSLSGKPALRDFIQLLKEASNNPSFLL